MQQLQPKRPNLLQLYLFIARYRKKKKKARWTTGEHTHQKNYKLSLLSKGSKFIQNVADSYYQEVCSIPNVLGPKILKWLFDFQ